MGPHLRTRPQSGNSQEMMAAGKKEALKQNVPMAMAISDSGGDLLAFQRMDNTMLSSTQSLLIKHTPLS
jgi:uncharacterized protein GlcG (DUF336 family)